ncbi:MAG: type II 3-dehydroquinate dehydratase [Desulfobacterota bacterium]|nr:type II 3-dehydroquinate dehydratase [Thermodesulfobacteriota bacterium]
MKLLVLHGPNLNMLGKREPEQYGKVTLEEINAMLRDVARQHNVEIEIYQSNHEGALIDKIHSAIGSAHGLLLNPGALTHTSIALRDAVIASTIPTVEVHLSNIYAREPFRRASFLSDVALGVISGFREYSYVLGLQALIYHLRAASSV